MLVWDWVVERGGRILLDSGVGGGGTGKWHVGIALGVTAMAGLALAATLVISSRRGSLKSPWSRRKRKRALSLQQWRSLFTPEGKMRDGGVKFLKKVRSGGIDPSIRVEVWPFLLGVYDLDSTEAERNTIRLKKRKEYEKLRKRSLRLLKHPADVEKEMQAIDESTNVESPSSSGSPQISDSKDACSAVIPNSNKGDPVHNGTCVVKPGSHEDEGENGTALHDAPCEESTNVESPSPSGSPQISDSKDAFSAVIPDNSNKGDPVHNETCVVKPGSHEDEGENGTALHDAPCEEDKSEITHVGASPVDTESSDSEFSTEELESMLVSTTKRNIQTGSKYAKIASVKEDTAKSKRTKEDFSTWQRIIRLDAIRANAEWVVYSPTQAAVSEDKALVAAASVGLKDYDHLEPCRIYHAARLVAVLEAYALYDQEIGYCQGMSDLLSPILAVMEEDDEAFWCFVGFMKKARHNFRLDEVGIRRQLNIVSKIIKSKDSHLFKHLEKLQAADCFFVYRMVVVLFRRELNFEETLCLWEVMWADQAAIRSGIGKSARGRIRLRAPPTEDLLLYAIAACVLQRRKLIIESYSSMDEIIRECNNMAGNLDVWKLLDDAHDLVVTLHDRIDV